ncbi:MAG: hypothetical protein KF733_03560 [Fimbriimonadaceae bacterium]|nr:MAG: hypothetical protein KF733_03560 [Fimbriimonadaceae bacterium]
MTYQDALARLIENAYDELFTNAEKLKDNLDYKAAESNRTPRQMLVECATVPPFLAETLKNRALASMDGEEGSASMSIEEAKAHYESVKGALLDAVRNFPADKLEEKIETPWGTFAWYEFMSYAYWNPMYHVGQMAYIQMIHGDTSM